MPSVEEAEQMLGTRQPEALAKRFKELGVKNVVIKLGSKGCYVEPAGEEGRYFSSLSVPCVDTSGAGDAWCAGFLTGLVKKMSVWDAAMLGNVVGAMCITQVGTSDGIADYETTMKFIKGRNMQ